MTNNNIEEVDLVLDSNNPQTKEDVDYLEIESSLEELENTFLPFFKVHKDGHIERFVLTTRENAGVDPITKTRTKDVVISTDPEISGRIFMPIINDLEDNDGLKREKMPLLVHYHGGGFCTGSAFGPIMKQYLSTLVSKAQIVAFAVEFRLAPEHPLPIAYDDSWVGFQWVANHAKGNGSDPWLKEYVDFNRVFLSGECTGANIAHDVAIRASLEPIQGIRLVGLQSIHPFFGSKEPSRLIKFLYPTSSGSNDEPRLNPAMDPNLEKLACDKVLVCVAGNDYICLNSGLAYIETLQTMWNGKVEVVETLGEGHCFHMLDLTSPNIEPLMDRIVSFIKEDN